MNESQCVGFIFYMTLSTRKKHLLKLGHSAVGLCFKIVLQNSGATASAGSSYYYCASCYNDMFWLEPRMLKFIMDISDRHLIYCLCKQVQPSQNKLKWIEKKK